MSRASRDSRDEVADFLRVGARSIDSRLREVALSKVLDSFFPDKSDYTKADHSDNHVRFIEECISCSDFNPNYVWRGDSILDILLRHDDLFKGSSPCFDSSIRLLVQRGARIDEKVLNSSLKATLCGGQIVLEHYLDHRAGNVNTKLANGDTLLHGVLKNLYRGSEFIISVLISRGARIDIPDGRGVTVAKMLVKEAKGLEYSGDDSYYNLYRFGFWEVFRDVLHREYAEGSDSIKILDLFGPDKLSFVYELIHSYSPKGDHTLIKRVVEILSKKLRFVSEDCWDLGLTPDKGQLRFGCKVLIKA